LARWSNGEIARRSIELGAVARIAASTVGRWLASEKLRPWRYHSWQRILDPEAFLERARPVLRLYERARELLAKGVWVVCADEKTSLQARRRKEKPRPAAPGQPVHISHRYERKGALHLFAALSVAEGKVYGQCRKRKRFVDFQAFLLGTVIPEALQRGVHTLASILDNGTTHAPKQLERWLKEQIEAHGWALNIQVYWLPTNASWLDQIEIWFSILQRKLLQPNHFERLGALKLSVLDFIAHYNQAARPIRWSYTVAKLEQKLVAHWRRPVLRILFWPVLIAVHIGGYFFMLHTLGDFFFGPGFLACLITPVFAVSTALGLRFSSRRFCRATGDDIGTVLIPLMQLGTVMVLTLLAPGR
jgi:transposase